MSIVAAPFLKKWEDSRTRDARRRTHKTLVADGLTGWGRDVPALDDLADEAVLKQALPARAAQLFGANGNMLILQGF